MCFDEPILPESPPARGEDCQAIEDPVQPLLTYRPVDGDTPKETGLARQRISVGQCRDRHGTLGQEGVVAEGRESDWSRPHEAAISSALSRVQPEVLSGLRRHVIRPGGVRKDPSCLVADVGWPRSGGHVSS